VTWLSTVGTGLISAVICSRMAFRQRGGDLGRQADPPGFSPWMLSVWVGDRRFGVLVRIQYAAAFNRRVSLGADPYSEWVARSHRYRTRLTVSLTIGRLIATN